MGQSLVEQTLVSDFNKPKLRDVSKAVLLVCLDKIQNKQSISFKDIYKMWLKTNPQMHWWGYSYRKTETGEEIQESKKNIYSKSWNECRAKQWFIRQIGVLVCKGYLAVLPNVNFINKEIGG